MTYKQKAYTLRVAASFVVVIFSLFMVGSCKVSGDAPYTVDYSAMSNGETQRYALALSSLLSVDPTTLNELSARDLRIVFQDPAIERNEVSSVFWQFASDSCVLDVFFQAAPDQLYDSNVAYYEMRPRRILNAKDRLQGFVNLTEEEPQKECLSTIAKHATVTAAADTGHQAG